MTPQSLTIREYLAAMENIGGLYVYGQQAVELLKPYYVPPKRFQNTCAGGWVVDVRTDAADYGLEIAQSDVDQAISAGLVVVLPMTEADIEDCDYDPGCLTGFLVLEPAPKPE